MDRGVIRPKESSESRLSFRGVSRAHERAGETKYEYAANELIARKVEVMLHVELAHLNTLYRNKKFDAVRTYFQTTWYPHHRCARKHI